MSRRDGAGSTPAKGTTPDPTTSPEGTMSIRAALDHTRRVYRSHTRLIELQDGYGNAPTAASEAVSAEQIADLLESQAEHLEASRLARATTALPSPARLREQSVEWRERAQEWWTIAAAESR